MPKKTANYIIRIHYPENQCDVLYIRKKIGNAYLNFIKDYIKNLEINDERKNELYSKICFNLLKK